MEVGLIAIGAGLAIGLAALGTAIAQAKIGAAAIGELPPQRAGRDRANGSWTPRAAAAGGRG